MITYSGDPAASSRDAVRFLIAETSTSESVIQDEEIDWILTQESNTYLAASQAARQLAAYFAKKARTSTVGELSVSYGERVGDYTKLASTLAQKAKSGSGIAIAAYAGGISKNDKEVNAADSDWDKPYFYRGIHDNHEATSDENAYYQQLQYSTE